MPELGNLTQIGLIESSISDRKQMPLQGVPAKVRIFDEFAEGLEGIERNTHLWVLCWLHESDRDVLTVRTRKKSPEAEPTGVFDTRSPSRPNPIALCPVKVLGVEGNAISVDRLDMIDGTPVLDLKPYATGWDCIFSAANRRPVKAWVEANELESLWREAVNYHGEECAPLALATRACLEAKRRLGELADPDMKVEAGVRGCALDGLEALTRATLGNGRLSLVHEKNAMTFRKGGQAFKALLAPVGETSTDDVLSAPMEDILEVRPPEGGLEEIYARAEADHGHLCPGMFAGVRMAMLGLRLLGGLERIGRKNLIVFAEMDRCATDALRVVTGCSVGRRSLKVLDYGTMAATFIRQDDGLAYRISLNPDNAEAGDSREQAARKFRELSEDKLFKVQKVRVELDELDIPGYPKKRAGCEECGTKVLDGREVLKGGKTLCKPCAGERYFTVLDE